MHETCSKADPGSASSLPDAWQTVTRAPQVSKAVFPYESLPAFPMLEAWGGNLVQVNSPIPLSANHTGAACAIQKRCFALTQVEKIFL